VHTPKIRIPAGTAPSSISVAPLCSGLFAETVARLLLSSPLLRRLLRPYPVACLQDVTMRRMGGGGEMQTELASNTNAADWASSLQKIGITNRSFGTTGLPLVGQLPTYVQTGWRLAVGSWQQDVKESFHIYGGKTTNGSAESKPGEIVGGPPSSTVDVGCWMEWWWSSRWRLSALDCYRQPSVAHTARKRDGLSVREGSICLRLSFPAADCYS